VTLNFAQFRGGVLATNLYELLPALLRSHRVAAALCALPPLSLTALSHNTSWLFSLCGVAGFVVVFFVPAALQHAARVASVKRWGEAGLSTPHSTCLSGPGAVLGVMVLSTLSFVYNVWVVVLTPMMSWTG